MGKDDQGGSRDRGDDAFEGLTLDDSFVKGAAISEASHRDREKDAKRQQRRDRRGRRTRGLGRGIRRSAPLLLAALVLIVAVGFGARGQGPLGQVDAIRRLGGLDPVTASAPDDPAPQPGDPSGTTTPTASTSTTIGLEGVDHDPGACITWDQSVGGVSTRQTTSVPCSDEHLFETTEAFVIDGTPYAATGPTPAEWDLVFDRECGPRAEVFLGYPLDPAGRFQATAITPTDDGWAQGDRTVTCGIGSTWTSTYVADQLPSFVGAVEGADQSLLWGVGTCFGAGADGGPVDCLGPHDIEIVGTADVSSLGPAYPGEGYVTIAAVDQCRAAAVVVYGAPLPDDVGIAPLPIAESSWNIGRRIVECGLGRHRGSGGEWETITGPLRAGSA